MWRYLNILHSAERRFCTPLHRTLTLPSYSPLKLFATLANAPRLLLDPVPTLFPKRRPSPYALRLPYLRFSLLEFIPITIYHRILSRTINQRARTTHTTINKILCRFWDRDALLLANYRATRVLDGTQPSFDQFSDHHLVTSVCFFGTRFFFPIAVFRGVMRAVTSLGAGLLCDDDVRWY